MPSSKPSPARIAALVAIYANRFMTCWPEIPVGVCLKKSISRTIATALTRSDTTGKRRIRRLVFECKAFAACFSWWAATASLVIVTTWFAPAPPQAHFDIQLWQSWLASSKTEPFVPQREQTYELMGVRDQSTKAETRSCKPNQLRQLRIPTRDTSQLRRPITCAIDRLEFRR